MSRVTVDWVSINGPDHEAARLEAFADGLGTQAVHCHENDGLLAVVGRLRFHQQVHDKLAVEHPARHGWRLAARLDRAIADAIEAELAERQKEVADGSH